MSLRLVQVILNKSKDRQLDAVLSEASPEEIMRWQQDLPDDRLLLNLFVEAEHTENLLDTLAQRFGEDEDFRVLLLPVQATLPRPEPEEEEEPQQEEDTEHTYRINREELYNGVVNALMSAPVYVPMTILATIVAAIGLASDDVAVVIGAMVITPLLATTVALSLATTLADMYLAKEAAWRAALGIALAFAVSVVFGFLIDVDTTVGQIANRTDNNLGSLLLALAAGAAGVFSFTTGLPTTLVGVTVAVALLPPLVACGILVGAGDLGQAGGALLLFVTNFVGVNLAGVVTLLVQGIQPFALEDKETARRSSIIAIAIWIVLLLALVWLIVQG